MADATVAKSIMLSDQQNSVALRTEMVDQAITAGSDEERTKEAVMSLHPSSDTRNSQTAYVVESVDISDEEYDKESVSDNSQYLASASHADDRRGLPTTPKVPWRKGGIWHLRSGQQRDGAQKHSTGSDGRPHSYPGDQSAHSYPGDESDSETDSNVSVREFHPDLYSHELDDTESEFGMQAWNDFLNEDLDSDNERDRPLGPPEEPLYPQGLLVETECYVCFEDTELRRRLCCDFPVCDRCLESYLMVQVLQANVNIECLNINCSSYIHRNEISARLPPKFKMKFYKFLIDANADPSVKTCPRCSNGLQVDKGSLRKRKVVKNGLPVTCKKCGLEWCFTCHAPLHKGLTCRDYRKGDILLKEWAREFHYGQLNAQQCPKCKIFIQRSLGCDHMICTRCSTNFCYRCGENYRGLKLLGNHFSRYSPFGCRYNFMPDAPHMRRLIRGAVLGGKILGGLVLSGFVVAAGACLLGVGIIALPAWGGYKLHKKRRFRQRLRANRKYAKQNLALRNLQAKKATELSVPSFPMAALDSSDSMADDSSDEVRDRIMVGVELPDSQRVEVLVHQTVSSSSDQEEGGAVGETREVTTHSAVIVTDVQEVLNEDGYTTVVTNVHAKPKDATHTSAAVTSSSDEGDEENRSDDEYSRSRSGKQERFSFSGKGNSTSSRLHGNEQKPAEGENGQHDENDKLAMTGTKLAESDGNDQKYCQSKLHKTRDRKEKESGLNQEKIAEEKDTNMLREKKEKPSEGTEKGDKKQSQSESNTEKEKEKLAESWEKNEKKPEKDSCPLKSADQKDNEDLNKESTNGCFGNIFSKKIAVIQIGSRRNTETQPDTQKTSNTCYKSSTWEKSREKSSQHKHKASMDIQDLSHFKEKLPLQSSDVYLKPAYEKGVLLQDFVVLSRPGDFGSKNTKMEGDRVSLASASSIGDGGSGREKGGEGSSCCCLSASDSFRGSNLSCDIVTYL